MPPFRSTSQGCCARVTFVPACRQALAVLAAVSVLHAPLGVLAAADGCRPGAAFAPTAGRAGSFLQRASQSAVCRTHARPLLGTSARSAALAPSAGALQWLMSHALSKAQAQRNKELNEQRREQNLAIAARVAAGELRPVVVSFSPALRSQLRLAKRFKHTRIFVETHEVQSLDALLQALVREVPHPLAELPPETYEVAVRPSAPDEDAAPDGSAESAWLCGEPLTTDEDLQQAYTAAQEARSSGVGKLRLCIEETAAFDAFLDARRGYTVAADGALPEGLAPADAASWILTSFYTLRPVPEVEALCKRLLDAWLPLGVLGRVYIAPEGVNAQVSR